MMQRTSKFQLTCYISGAPRQHLSAEELAFSPTKIVRKQHKFEALVYPFKNIYTPCTEGLVLSYSASRMGTG